MASLENLTDAELRRQLKELGETPGPITATTRAIYIKKLGKLKELEVGCGMFVYGIASTSMSLFYWKALFHRKFLSSFLLILTQISLELKCLL